MPGSLKKAEVGEIACDLSGTLTTGICSERLREPGNRSFGDRARDTDERDSIRTSARTLDDEARLRGE